MIERFVVWRVSSGHELMCGEFKTRQEAEDYVKDGHTNLKAHGIEGINYVIQAVKMRGAE